jgi:hypothetical protein
MHQTIPEQGFWLAQVIRGYFAYHAVPTNFPALSAFRYHVRRLWLRTLRRRSQKDSFSWERMTKLADDLLPQPKILHPWPSVRFAVTTQGGRSYGATTEVVAPSSFVEPMEVVPLCVRMT